MSTWSYEKNREILGRSFKGHVWMLDEDFGGVDFHRVSYEFHNGPECVNCGYSFCEHCTLLDEIPPCEKSIQPITNALTEGETK